MTEWSVVGVIVALVGLLTAVATPMVKLNSTLVKLSVQIQTFSENLAAFQKRYSEHLAELRHVDETQESKIENHEYRITVLENSHDKKI